ncbi:hypothetical protein D3C75_1174600 [compost metagenome]
MQLGIDAGTGDLQPQPATRVDPLAQTFLAFGQIGFVFRTGGLRVQHGFDAVVDDHRTLHRETIGHRADIIVVEV